METQRKPEKLKAAHELIGELDLELRAVKAELRQTRQRGRGRSPRRGRTRQGIPLAYVDQVERHWGTEAGETLRS